MIISILANGAAFKWSSGLEADQRFKSKTFKLYRKAVNRTNRLHSNMPLKIPGLNDSLNRSTESVGISPQSLDRINNEILDTEIDLNPFTIMFDPARLLMFGPRVERIME